MADDISAEELAALRKLRDEREMEALLTPMLDRRQCLQAGIEFDETGMGAHRPLLNKRFADLNEILAAHSRNNRWLGAAGAAVGKGASAGASKVLNLLLGALALMGANWLLARFGIKIPGVG